MVDDVCLSYERRKVVRDCSYYDGLNQRVDKLMKTLRFKFTGDSKLVYLYLFKVDVVEKLKEIEEGEYDFIDFWTTSN